MQIEQFTFNGFQVNAYLLIDDSSKDCAIIDPSCESSSEQNELYEYIKAQELHVKYLLNTHGHVDHVLGNSFVTSQFGVKPLLHPEDLFLYEQAEEFAAIFGLSLSNLPKPELILEGGQEYALGNDVIKTMHLPGHSPGSIAFYVDDAKFAVVGDVLFSGSIGRSDLPGGHHETLINAIKHNLFNLDGQFVIYPGHGPETTIENEKKTNPFLI